MPRDKPWNMLEALKIPFKLRFFVVTLYEKIITKFQNTKDRSKESNCNIRVKQGCSLSHTLFGLYIDMLEDCLEEARCVISTLIGVVIILLLYIDYIVLMARSPYDLGKQIIIFKYFYYSIAMIANTNKMKVMIIKSKNITHNTFIYDNKNLEEVPSYQYLGINMHHKLK
jgi:hypothetical protein